MRKPTLILSAILCSLGILTTSTTKAQAFRKGAFIINISEGSTNAIYGTKGGPGEGSQTHIIGTRDPLTLEYGLCKHFGIGFSSGTDFYFINPNQFYNYSLPSNGTVKAMTSEFTIDGSYHFFTTQRTDFSAVLSYGPSGVMIRGNDGDINYSYNSVGSIVRFGLHGRIYIGNHFGFLAMLSAFSQGASTTEAKSASTFGKGYTTSIHGTALEFGFCWKFKK